MKKTISAVITLILFTCALLPGASATEKSSELADDARSAILIERDTGTVLYEKNSRERFAPASMTKIMTMLLIMEAIADGKLRMDEKVRTSDNAASMGGSQIFLEPGEEMTAREMLMGIAIGSANDASVAMAEKVAGSEAAFVEQMNRRAKELGLKDTHFKNTTGLMAKDHYSSARDMSIMAKELLKHEQITEFTKQYESYLRENSDKKFWLVNTNKLVRFYPGVDGLKTGFTNEAKYCLTATAKKDNMRVIAVVFGASTPKSRNAQITKMLDYAYSQYTSHPLVKKGETLGEVQVSKGEVKKVKVVTSEPISVLTKKGEKLEGLQHEVKLKKDMRAPIKKGQEVGMLLIRKDGRTLASASLEAKQDVKEASWWQLYKRAMGMFTKSGS